MLFSFHVIQRLFWQSITLVFAHSHFLHSPSIYDSPINLQSSMYMYLQVVPLSRVEYMICFQIRVGVTFTENTVLQLRNPKRIAQAGSYTKVSLFFKTNERNGFLAYIGPDQTSGSRILTVSHSIMLCKRS